MGYGAQLAYAGAGAQESLDQMIQRRMAEISQAAAIENMRAQRENEARRIENDTAYRQASLASLDEQRKANAELRAQQQAAQLTSLLTPGSTLDADAAQTLKSGNLGTLIQHKDAALPATSFAGGATAGASAPIIGQLKAMETGGPARDVYTGTAAQQEAERKKQFLRGFINRPDLPPEAKMALEYEDATGKQVPANLIKPQNESVPVMRVNPRTGKMEQVGEAPKGTHFVTEPAPVNINASGLNPYQVVETTRNLRNDYQKIVQPARVMRQQLNYMNEGLSAAARGDLNAGSQAVLVTFQKILDPTSVVRESEYARSAAGLGLLQRMQGILPKLQAGGAGVPLAELKKFGDLAKQFTDNAEASARANAGPLLSQAKALGIDLGQIDASSGAAPTDASAARRVKYDIHGNPIKD